MRGACCTQVGHSSAAAANAPVLPLISALLDLEGAPGSVAAKISQVMQVSEATRRCLDLARLSLSLSLPCVWITWPCPGVTSFLVLIFHVLASSSSQMSCCPMFRHPVVPPEIAWRGEWELVSGQGGGVRQ
jgi:hypothetical protein